jgi:hypothetical protein
MERIAARLAEGRRHRLHELHPVMPVGGHEVLLLQKCRDGQEEVRGLGCVGHELVQADHEVEPRQRRLVAAVSGIWFTKLVCMKSAVVTGGSVARSSAGAIWETGRVRAGAVRAASASNSGLRISRHGQLVRLTPPPGNADIAGQHAEGPDELEGLVTARVLLQADALEDGRGLAVEVLEREPLDGLSVQVGAGRDGVERDPADQGEIGVGALADRVQAVEVDGAAARG